MSEQVLLGGVRTPPEHINIKSIPVLNEIIELNNVDDVGTGEVELRGHGVTDVWPPVMMAL
jgi:hypothetical protein